MCDFAQVGESARCWGGTKNELGGNLNLLLAEKNSNG